MARANVVALRKPGPTAERILAPTDGSARSIAGALKAVDFARRLQTHLVVFTSIPAYQYPIYLGGIPFEYPSESEYQTECRAIAKCYLRLVVDIASEQAVTASQRLEFDGNATQAILAVAENEHCNLITMSSHGRSGLSRMFLGSVALKILTLAHLPVLVDHPTLKEISVAESLMKEYAIDS